MVKFYTTQTWIPPTQDVNQDGASVVGDVDFGFSGLRKFGLQLLNHLTLKVRTLYARTYVRAQEAQ